MNLEKMCANQEESFLLPYKISVLILIEKYNVINPNFWGNDTANTIPSMSFLDSDFTSKKRKLTCKLIPSLIRGAETDMSLIDLLEVVVTAGISKKHTNSFIIGLDNLYKNGVDGLHALFDSVEKFCLQDINKSVYPCLWMSIVGLHVRQMNLLFRRLNFSHISSIYEQFVSYYEDCFIKEGYKIDDNNKINEENKENQSDVMDVDGSASILFSRVLPESMQSDMSSQGLNVDPTSPVLKLDASNFLDKKVAFGLKTRQQSEIFIQKQIYLLLQQSSLAKSADQINKIVVNVLKNYPDMGKAHFLGYLNALREKDQPLSMYSLLRAYDSKCTFKDPNREELSRSFRYAALNMAALHAHFQHHSIALTHLRESILLAQESGDDVCLQYSLAWLYSISNSNKLALTKRCQDRSSEINLSYLSWLSVLGHSVELTRKKAPPKTVLNSVINTVLPAKSNDVSTVEHSTLSSQASLWAVHSSFWTLWGNISMSAVCSQLVLHMAPPNCFESIATFSTNPTCTALCNLALTMFNTGQMDSANDLLNQAETQFSPSNDRAKSWMFTKYFILFYEKLRRGQFSHAKSYVLNMASVHKDYSKLFETELLLCKGDHSSAFEITKEILQISDNWNVKDMDSTEKISCFLSPELRIKFLLLQSEALALGQNLGNSFSVLINTIELARQSHMIYLESFAHLQLASVQMQLGLHKQALESFDMGVDVIFAGGGLYDQARTMLLQAKLQVCCFEKSKRKETMIKSRKETMIKSAALLEKAQLLFNKVNATLKEKEVMYLKARFYNELSMVEERNKCALEFRQLEQKCPTLPDVIHLSMF